VVAPLRASFEYAKVLLAAEYFQSAGCKTWRDDAFDEEAGYRFGGLFVDTDCE